MGKIKNNVRTIELSHYLIYTTILSKRLTNFINQIMDEDQTGFTKGQQTHDNIRRTLHLIDHAQKKKQGTVLVSIDAEKAFDQLNWEFLYEALKLFGFSKKSVQCIKTLLKDPTARVKINRSNRKIQNTEVNQARMLSVALPV